MIYDVCPSSSAPIQSIFDAFDEKRWSEHNRQRARVEKEDERNAYADDETYNQKLCCMYFDIISTRIFTFVISFHPKSVSFVQRISIKCLYICCVYIFPLISGEFEANKLFDVWNKSVCRLFSVDMIHRHGEMKIKTMPKKYDELGKWNCRKY